MTQTLGRIIAERDSECGPDALFDVVVEREWLRDAKTIEVDLPRHLCCAACQGAGCDICAQSGAITVRGRAELAETVRVTLPQQTADSSDCADSTRTRVLKVPGYGGLPDPNSGVTTRGRLLLRVSTNGPISSCIRSIQPSEPALPEYAVDSSVVSRQADSGRQSQRTTVLGKQTTSATNAVLPESVDGLLSQTARSMVPPEPQVPAARSTGDRTRKQKTTNSAVEPSIGWTWRDTFVGLVLLALGAIFAWCFIQPR